MSYNDHMDFLSSVGCVWFAIRPERHLGHSTKSVFSFDVIYPPSQPTLVVFYGKIRVVEHLWHKTIVKEVTLDGIIFVHCADSLDHL